MSRKFWESQSEDGSLNHLSNTVNTHDYYSTDQAYTYCYKTYAKEAVDIKFYLAFIYKTRRKNGLYKDIGYIYETHAEKWEYKSVDVIYKIHIKIRVMLSC